ncbi:hypothetical protein [Thalassobaculum litoreum]|uniref:Phage abortive infection protein n=1 Tax=Thalassobaculum litoreum DSM 18839 TaxID=1123362 RepID=A0A8G2BN83_9PROT|nr:hypothetical protein [Thalassobaculum litoreum]SDG50788.1 hypothetical protein SAMN05660686_04659 [Thalassobaculum litoreum DSM 18839]
MLGGIDDHRRQQRRVQQIAVFLTVLVVGVSLVVLFDLFGLSGVTELEPNETGDTIAGFAGILAFIWLIAGYFLQKQELQLNTEAVKQQAEEIRATVVELEKQNESLKQSELFNKRSILIRMIELRQREIDEYVLDFCARCYLVNGKINNYSSNMNIGVNDAGYLIMIQEIPENINLQDQLKKKIEAENMLNWISGFNDLMKIYDDMEDGGSLRASFERSIRARFYILLCKLFENEIEFKYRAVID